MRFLVISCLSDYHCLKLTIRFFFFPFSQSSSLPFLISFFQNARLKAKGTLTVCMVELVSVFLPKTVVPSAIAQQTLLDVVVNISLRPLTSNKIVIINWIKMWIKCTVPQRTLGNQTTYQLDISFKSKLGALTIYTKHPGGNFRCKYSVLQLFQTQNSKIWKCISINWKVQKWQKKCID